MNGDLNAVNAAQTEAPAPIGTEASDGIVDPRDGRREAGPPDGAAGTERQDRQARAANAKFAEMRRERDRLSRELEETRRLLGAKADAPESAENSHVNLSALHGSEQGSGDRASERAAEKTLKAENGALRRLLYQSCFEKDLAQIRESWPDEKAETVGGLGEMFSALRAFGVDNLTAYAAVRESGRIKHPAAPPETGALDGSSEAYREFYTSAEADRLTSGQLDNPKIMEKVMKSMKRWK